MRTGVARFCFGSVFILIFTFGFGFLRLLLPSYANAPGSAHISQASYVISIDHTYRVLPSRGQLITCSPENDKLSLSGCSADYPRPVFSCPLFQVYHPSITLSAYTRHCVVINAAKDISSSLLAKYCFLLI